MIVYCLIGHGARDSGVKGDTSKGGKVPSLNHYNFSVYRYFIDAKRVPSTHCASQVTFFPTPRTGQTRCHQISEASLVEKEVKGLAPVKINLHLKKQL